MSENQSTYYRSPGILPVHFPKQHQNVQPGDSSFMQPVPQTDNPYYQPAGKLTGRVAIVTGGDSGIGQAVAIAFAKEGADVVIAYYGDNEKTDAAKTQQAVEGLGRRFLGVQCDLTGEQATKELVQQTIDTMGRLDVLVNNIAVQYPQNSIEDIPLAQLQKTFDVNVFSSFSMIQAAMPHLKPGGSIVNTVSVTAYKGHPTLIDYSSSKGALVSLTRSLSQSLAKSGIRVNAVAPGPVWTPLIAASFSPEEVEKFGTDTPMGRAAQPFELAPAYVYLASDDAAYVSGQVLHVNGGVIVDS